MIGKIFNNAYFKAKEEEPKQTEGVNGPVITYYMPINEIIAKYGPVGSTNGYVSPPIHGKSIRSER